MPPIMYRRNAGSDLYLARCGGWSAGAAEVSVTLEDIEYMTVGLATIEFRTPASLANSMASWARLGLLDLLDDAVMFINAPLPGQVAAGEAAGFRVFTTEPAVLDDLLATHHDDVAAIFATSADLRDTWPTVFPIRRTQPDGSVAMPVGNGLLLATLNMTTEVTLFLEKDFALAPAVTRRDLIRSLLTSVGLLEAQFQFVRLRRLDDPSREGIPNVCTEPLDNYSNFQLACAWQTMLDWLKIFCDTADIEASSQRAVARCMDEAKDPDLRATRHADDAPLATYCFSMDHSGWSNNAVLYRRAWWVDAIGGSAALSESGMSMELNNHMLCNRRAPGQTPATDMPMQACQLAPGLFNMEEIDGRRLSTGPY